MIKFFIIILSLLISLMLNIAPLPKGLLPLNPAWCLITLLFWTYHNPHRVNVGVAWIIGIMLDALTGTLLGTHAFSFVVIIYLFDLFYRRFHMFSIVQQSLIIGVFVLSNFFMIAGINYLLAGNVIIWPSILSAVIGVICWPLYQSIGRKLNLVRG